MTIPGGVHPLFAFGKYQHEIRRSLNSIVVTVPTCPAPPHPVATAAPGPGRRG